MKIVLSKTSTTSIISYISVVVYFWLYILMYWFGVKGVIPFEMGLHRSLINLLSLVIILVFFLELIKKPRLEVYDISFFVFVLLVSFLILTHHYFDQKLSDMNGVSVMKYTIFIVVQYLVCFFIGKYFFIPFNEVKRKFLIFGHVICCIVLFSFMSNEGIIIDVTDMEHGQKGIYLFTSEYLAFFSFFLVASCNSRKEIIITILICSLLIFCFISRSALFIFMVSSWLLYFKHYKFTSIVFLALLSISIFLNIDYLYEHYPRMFFFLDFMNDVSFQGREIQKEVGYMSLYNNLFWGDYGGQVKTLGYVGEYIHNIISYWRQFGVISFVLIIYMVFYKPLLLFFNDNRINSFEYNLFYMMVIYVCLQSVFSRSFSWPFLFLYIGLVSAYIENKKYNYDAMGKSI